MICQIVFSPNLEITPEEFLTQWNKDQKCIQKAKAEIRHEIPKGYPVDLTPALIYLSGFIAGIALDILKDMIKEKVKAAFSQKKPAIQMTPEFEIVPVPQPDGTLLLVVKPKSS